MVFETVSVPGAVILPRRAHHLSRLWASATHANQAPLAEKFPDGRCSRAESFRSLIASSITARSLWNWSASTVVRQDQSGTRSTSSWARARPVCRSAWYALSRVCDPDIWSLLLGLHPWGVFNLTPGILVDCFDCLFHPFCSGSNRHRVSDTESFEQRYGLIGPITAIKADHDLAYSTSASYPCDGVFDESPYPSGGVGRSLAKSLIYHLSGICSERKQWVIASALCVAEVGPLFLISVHLAYGGVNVYDQPILSWSCPMAQARLRAASMTESSCRS